MDIELYRTPIDAAGLAVALAGSIVLYCRYQTLGSICIIIGFLLMLISTFAINYCIGIALLTSSAIENVFFCSPVLPYVKAASFICIGLGMAALAKNR